MTTILETPRLVLRLFRPADTTPCLAMNADPRVGEFLGGTWTAERSAEHMAWANETYPAVGIGMLAIERRADCAFLGMAGLNRLDWFPDDIEVGWRLLPAVWGHGYATEAGRAWLGLAFRRHGVPRVISVADAANLRSRAVMERLGLRLWRRQRLVHGDDLFDAAVHAIGREAWEAAG
jgi:RimJ/RimL family protein N-acetyltransferase